MSDVPIDRFVETSEQLEKRKKTGAPSSAPPHKAVALPQQNIQSQQAAREAPPSVQQTSPTIPNETAVASARALTSAATSLDGLKERLLSFEGCNLKFTARSTVFSDGAPDADLMIIGGAPDRDEDEQGIPFVGMRGQLFDKMLAAIQLDRKNSYLACVLPWRPPGNRPPSPAEMDICRPLIEKHIELANPKSIVLVGSLPVKMLLGKNGSVMSSRGKWAKIEVGGKEIDTLSMLNPAYLLQNSQHKRLAWNDLLTLKQHLSSSE